MTAIADEEQGWFWSEEWQAGEREAEADIAGGHVYCFDTSAEAILFLRFCRGEGSGKERHPRTEGS